MTQFNIVQDTSHQPSAQVFTPDALGQQLPDHQDAGRIDDSPFVVPAQTPASPAADTYRGCEQWAICSHYNLNLLQPDEFHRRDCLLALYLQAEFNGFPNAREQFLHRFRLCVASLQGWYCGHIDAIFVLFYQNRKDIIFTPLSFLPSARRALACERPAIGHQHEGSGGVN